MLDTLFRALAELGPTTKWFVVFFAAIVALFALYVGIAMWAVLKAPDDQQRTVRYEIFRDLLSLFKRGKQ